MLFKNFEYHSPLFKIYSPWLRGKESPVMQETQEMWVQPLSWEDSLEEEMGQRSLVGYSSMDRGVWWATRSFLTNFVQCYQSLASLLTFSKNPLLCSSLILIFVLYFLDF